MIVSVTDREARMTEIDPDWREHFADVETAELFYAKQPPRKLGRVIYSSGAREEPDDIADAGEDNRYLDDEADER